MKALSVDVDFATGRRSGGIDPRDPNLPCNPAWQDTEGGREIRVVVNGDVEKYQGVLGVTILDGEQVIDAAVAEVEAAREPEYVVWDANLLNAHIAQKRIDLDDFAGQDAKVVYRKLCERGILGVCKVKRTVPKAADMKRSWIDRPPPARGRRKKT